MKMQTYTKDDATEALENMGLNKISKKKYLDLLEDKEYTCEEFKEVWVWLYYERWFNAFEDELLKLSAKHASAESDEMYLKYFGDEVEIV
jgi:hypothetical protein